MGFWPFGGGKKKRSSRLEDPELKVVAEKLRQEPLISAGRSSGADPEKMAGTQSKGTVSDRSKKLSKSASRDQAVAVPGRTRPTPEVAGSSSRRTPTASSERVGKRGNDNGLYQQNPTSRSSIGPENFNVVKTPPTLRRRSDHAQTVPRHKSSKRKAEEHAREREVRAMSSPIPIPKRPTTTRSMGPLRQDTKHIPGDLNRHFERPKSEVSLPLPESFSEMQDPINQHSFKVNTFAVLSPRPTIKYNGSSGLGSPPPQSRSRASARDVITEEDFSPGKRIDELANNLDAGGLRELMDRDAKRREKKRDTDKAKLQRKLQRRADRQREEERQRSRGTDSRPYTPKGKAARSRTGLGIESDLSSSPLAPDTSGRNTRVEQLQSSPMGPGTAEDVPASATPAAAAVDPFSDEKALEDEHVSQEAPPAKDAGYEPEVVTDPFSHEEDREVEQPLEAASNDPSAQRDDDSVAATASAAAAAAAAAAGVSKSATKEVAKEPELPVRSPLREAERSEAAAQALPSPPASPVAVPAERESISQASTLAREQTPEIPDSVEKGRRDSGQGGGYGSTWTTFFKRGGRRKRSDDRGRSTPEFSNTSRESFSRQNPPPVVPPRSFRRSGSGTPQRTRSKFREDLPERPISPPDSRMQSPENAPAHYATTVTPAAMVQPNVSLSNLPEGRALEPSTSIPTLDRSRQDDQSSQKRSVELPGSDAQPSVVALSQSLASVDSEASWLSGRPAKRNSGPLTHALRQSQSSLSQPFASGGDEREEGDVAEDEYFNRLTPAPEETRRSSSGGMRKASSTAINLGEEGEQSPEPELPPLPNRAGETWHGSVGRQPTLVRQTSRARSKEGLLKEFQSAEPGHEDDSDSAEEEEGETPEVETVQRARSVEYGKGHARHISAGSARLLDIRRSSIQSEAANIPSIPKTPTTPAPMMSSQEEEKTAE